MTTAIDSDGLSEKTKSVLNAAAIILSEDRQKCAPVYSAPNIFTLPFCVICLLNRATLKLPFFAY